MRTTDATQHATSARRTGSTRLEAALAALVGEPSRRVAVGGSVTEVAPAYLPRRAASSPFVQLGECVDARVGRATRSSARSCASTPAGVTVKPFEATLRPASAPPPGGAASSRSTRMSPGRAARSMRWASRSTAAGPLRRASAPVSTEREPPAPMRRQRVRTPVKTGVKVIDLFTPLCAGQRIGIFAGSGIGKSTLLAMLARSQGFDTTVIALVGERGREVREFIEDALGRDRARAVTVVATGDESPMMRRLAPKTAMCIAEHFRDRGAQRAADPRFDDALCPCGARRRPRRRRAAGRARLYAERVQRPAEAAGARRARARRAAGSITGIFSVLVDGDDHNDPVADSIRGTLDGHIVLDRAIAEQARYPAVNVLASVSRLRQQGVDAGAAQLSS